jgi:hypothetical protein
MKKNHYSINFIGSFFCFFLLSFFSFHPNAYPAPSDYFDTVQKIYIGYYQRPADPGGLIYWAGRLDNAGGSFAEIIEAYANSAESQALYGTINSGNISTVVNGIYYALFGRNAEAGGLNYYVTGFNSGRFTAATIMLNVLYGAQNEDLQSVNNKLTAANLFTGTIDPELDGTNFQVTYAGNGDAIAARNFLALYATSVKVPTQAETTAYIIANIADPRDILILKDAAVGVCSGNGVTGAATYTKGVLGPHKIVFMKSNSIYYWPPDWPSQFPSNWQATSLSETELVGCIEIVYKEIQTCNYFSSHGLCYIYREQETMEFSLFSAHTGEKIGMTTFYGGVPNACPASATFSTYQWIKYIYGSDVSLDDIKSWLSPYVD